MIDLSKFSDEDLDALEKRDITKLSDKGLDLYESMLSGEKQKPKQSLLTEIQRGAEQLGSSGQTAIESLYKSPEDVIARSRAREEDISKRLGEKTSALQKIEETYAENGLLPAITTGLGEIPKAIAGQVPQIATTFTGARLGAGAGAFLGPEGALVGGLGGSLLGMFLPSFIEQYGGNIERQADVQKDQSKSLDINRGKAALAAVPQAALDVAENLIPFGGSIAIKIFGKDIANMFSKGLTKEAEEAAAKKLTEETFLPSLKKLDLGTVVKGTTKAAAMEIPTEIAQQMLERKQAGLDLFSPDALKEYGETAFDIALLGPLGIFGRVADKAAARQTILQAQQKAKDTGETQSTVLQLPYDPSVPSGAVNHQVVKIHPDGSTSFPSEFNNFYQNPVDELTDAGLKEKYEPQKVEQAKTILQQSFMNPEDQKRIDDARAQAVRVQAGHFDLLDKLVEQKKQKDAEIQAKKDAIYAAHSAFNPIFTEKTYDELGIGKTAYIRRNKILDGLDRSNPEDNQKIIDVLTEHANKDISPATKQKINDYLQNPYGTVYGREFLQPDGSIKTREQINKELQGVSEFAPLINRVAFFPRGSDEVEVFEGEVVKNKDGDYVLKYQKGNRTNERKLDMGDVVINPDPTDIEMLKAQRELTIEDKILRENDVFKKFLKKYGISSKERRDLGQQDNPGSLTYFRDNGLRLDDLLELAYENNFIPRISENPFTVTGESIDNENILRDYINQAISGEVVPVGKNIDQYAKIQNIRGYIDSLELSKDVPYEEDILYQINKEQLQREANRRIEELYFQNPELATEKAPVKEVEKVEQVPKEEQKLENIPEETKQEEAVQEPEKLDSLSLDIPNEGTLNMDYFLSPDGIFFRKDSIADKLMETIYSEVNGVDGWRPAGEGTPIKTTTEKAKEIIARDRDFVEKTRKKLEKKNKPEPKEKKEFNALEKEALEIADKVESYGQKGFAGAIRNRIKNNIFPPIMAEKELNFWRSKEQEFAAQAGKAKEPIKEKISMENFAEGYPNDIKRLRESNNLFDTETFDMVNKTNDYLQKLTDKLNSLGYSYLSQGITNNEADKLKTKISQIAGSTSRLLKEHEHLFKNDRFANQKKYDGVVKTLEQDFIEANELLGLKQEKPKLELLQPTEKLTNNVDELARRMRKSLDQMGLKEIGLNLEKNLKEMVNGKLTPVSGKYLNKVISVSLESSNVFRTLNHEAIHALKALGMFSDAEWKVLKDYAEKHWMKDFNIAENYAEFTKEEQIEEAIAHAFPQYLKYGGREKTLLQRIGEVLQRIRNVFRGMGFMTNDMVFNTTAEDVFRKVKEGRLTGNKEILLDGLRLDKSNSLASFLPERLNRIINSYAYTMDDKSTKAYITNISPKDFLKATTTDIKHENEIREKTGELDREKLKEYDMYPYLEVEKVKEGYKIVGHEGRHRMAALDRAGITSVPIVVIPRGGRIYDAKPIEKGTQFISQYFENAKKKSQSGFVLEDEMLPLSYKYSNEVTEKYSNPSANVKFEISKDAFKDIDPKYAEQLRNTFGKKKKSTIREKFDELKPNFVNKIVNGLFDEFGAIKNLAQAAKEGGDVNDLSSKFGRSYILARMSKSVDGGLSSLLHYGNLELKDGALAVKPNTKGLIEIYKPIGNEVDQYQIWKALNREARLPDDKKSFDPQMVARRNELVKGTLDGKSRLDVYNQVLKEEKELNKSVLDIAKKQGLITQDAYDIFANDLFYVPFYKAMEDENGINAFSVDASSKLTNQYFSKALKGGEKRVNDLTENMLLNWSHILSASMKNKAGLETLSAASQMGIAEKVKSTYEGKDVIKVRENGEIAYYAVKDPNLLDCISLINYVGPKNVFINTAKGFNNMLRYGVTLSPAYKIRNLIRDTVQSAAVSPLSMNLASNIYKGLQLTRDGNPTYMQALAGGGIFEMGSTYEGDQAALTKRLIKKGVNPKNIWDTTQKIKDGLESTLDWYQKQGGRFENANRVALYDKLIKEGKSHLEASFAARDLMDFSLQGSFRAVKILSQTIPFFNARLQGLYKIGRDGVTPTYRLIYNTATGKEVDATDKQKALQFSVMTSAVALASIFMYLSYKDDDDFKKREDWDRDNYWWFKVGDEAIRIPKPFEIGAFGTIAERTVEQMADENVEGEVFAKRLYSILKDQFHILDVPQIIKPVVDIYANKDSFTGAPIESAGLERLSKQERITNDTSRIAIALGGLSQMASSIFNGPGAEGMSPVQVDYAIKSYLGWVGASSVAISDKALDQFADINKPSKSLAEISGLASFAKELPDKQSRWVTNFYESNQRIQQAYDDMKNYAAIGQQEKVQKILEEKGDLIAMQSMYDQISKQIAQYRQYVKQVTNLPNMTKEDKENEIRRAQVVMSRMAQLAEETRLAMRRQRAQS